MMPANAIALSEYGTNRVYDRYLSRQMILTTGQLRTIVTNWDRKSLVGRVIGSLNPFDDTEMKASVARDLLVAQEYPYGKSAKKIKLMRKNAV